MSDENVKRSIRVVATLRPDTAGGKKDKENTNGEDEKADKEENSSTANALIALAEKSCEFFHDERGDEYAIVTGQDIQRTLKLRSKPFPHWLRLTFYKTTGRAPNREALSSALSVLEAKATYDNPQKELFNRFAKQGDEIFIDMADDDWRAVKVTATGWSLS